jgi:sensor c-di-GMP phosphodiesterase-like protein
VDAAGGAAIASAVIGLARGLGLDVVAEGVEKRSQLAFLEKLGCNACQGYLLCPPLPAAEFEKWLRERRTLPKAEAPDGRRAKAARPAASKPAAKKKPKARAR